MMVGDGSVTVTVVIDDTTVTYELERVQDFTIETTRDPRPPLSAGDDLRVVRADPPGSITFSMRPFASDDGVYMKVAIHEAEA